MKSYNKKHRPKHKNHLCIFIIAQCTISKTRNKFKQYLLHQKEVIKIVKKIIKKIFVKTFFLNENNIYLLLLSHTPNKADRVLLLPYITTISLDFLCKRLFTLYFKRVYFISMLLYYKFYKYLLVWNGIEISELATSSYTKIWRLLTIE